MVEFRLKAHKEIDLVAPETKVSEWRQMKDVATRSILDLEFDYCDYRICGTIYTELTPDFRKAFGREKLWAHLHG